MQEKGLSRSIEAISIDHDIEQLVPEGLHRPRLGARFEAGQPIGAARDLDGEGLDQPFLAQIDERMRRAELGQPRQQPAGDESSDGAQDQHLESVVAEAGRIVIGALSGRA